MLGLDTNNLITAKQLAEKYPVNYVRPELYWRDRLRLWRETQYLVDGRHWVKLHRGQEGRPAFAYVEACIVFLVRRDAKEDEFCHEVYRLHKDAMIALLREYSARAGSKP